VNLEFLSGYIDWLVKVVNSFGNSTNSFDIGSFQTIAVGCIIVGLLFAYVGFLFFRYVLGLTGFLIGGYLGLTFFPYIPMINDLGMLGKLFMAAAVGAVFSFLFYMIFFQLGMFIFGAAGSLWLGMMFMPAFESESEMRLLVILAIGFTGGIIAFFFKRLIIILVTSGVGAAMTILGLGHFMEWPISATNFSFTEAITNNFYEAIWNHPDGQLIAIATVLIFATGMAAQMKTPKRLDPDRDH
jgi:hypothetical protein